jgi:cytochrome P460
MRRVLAVAAAVVSALLGACAATLPYDVAGYESRCTRLNVEPIPPRRDERHHGFKNVYACNVDREQLRGQPRHFPDGTLIVKEARRPNESFVWLIALARKHGGVWEWGEYTRNFSDDELRQGFASADVCTGCHAEARGDDWIFTRYQRE